MEQNLATNRLPTTASNPVGTGGAQWQDPNNILTDDSNYAYIGLAGSGSAALIGSDFDFKFPDGAVIDGVEVIIKSSFHAGGWLSITISNGLTGTTFKDASAVDGVYGGPTDLWGADSIDPSDIESSLELTLDAFGTVDDYIYVENMQVTVYWHIDLNSQESDVPTRVDYKVYSRAGNYLGLLPNVSSKLAFPEDINSAGTSMVITCGSYINNEVTVSPLLTEAGDPITTEDDRPIVATQTDLMIAQGSSPDEAMFKNSNRVYAWLYNKYYPNGKLMFSGEINRVSFKYGGVNASVNLTVYTDGIELNNFIARGYPFAYTTDVSQTSQNGYVTNKVYSIGGWDIYGQTWQSGGSVDNLGEVVLKLGGTGRVTLSVYDAPNGNFIGSVSKSVSVATSGVDVAFDFTQLLDISPSTEYFLVPWVAAGQSVRIYRHSTSSTYANGSMYRSQYSGGSGGGAFTATTGDFYFITKSGTPTTTATYSNDDPVSDMASGIFADYNDRGGVIKERDFDATGLSLTYTFVVAFIYDALKKILELCPTGYYAYVDVGTAEIDIKQTSTTADFTVVRGRHINELDIDMTIEQVKNYLLFTGGDVSGSNLYRDYKDTESSAYYGLRTAAKTDNRVTLTATADAIGDTFIQENSDEQQQTTLTVLNEHIDITLLTPGKTIGFKNFGNFIDDLVLQIVRRECNYSNGVAVLTLGQLPVRMNDVVQRINRQLLNEQTISNPSSPS